MVNNFPPFSSLEGHEGAIRGVCELSNGRILSWSLDGTLRIWTNSGQPLAVTEGHIDWVAGACELRSRRILSWGHDSTLRMWSDKGKLTQTIQPRCGPIYGAQELDSGSILVFSHNPVPSIWRGDGLPDIRFVGHTAQLRGIIPYRNNQFLSWSDDLTVRVWGADGSALGVLREHQKRILGVVVLSDGRVLTWCRRHAPLIWNPDTGKVVRFPETGAQLHGGWELSDTRILMWHEDHTLRLWAASGTLFGLVHLDPAGISHVTRLNGDRFLIQSGDGTLRILNTENSTPVVLGTLGEPVRGTRELGNGNIVTWGSQINLWNGDGEHITRCTGHTKSIRDVLELSDGRLLSCSWDCTMRVWSSTGNLLAVLGRDATPWKTSFDDLCLLATESNDNQQLYHGYGWSPTTAVSWDDAGTVTPQSLPKKLTPAGQARIMAEAIERHAGDGRRFFLSLRSTWATQVLLELDRKVLPHIRGIQCTDATVYEEITGVMPELELNLLQFTRLPGTETLNTLYGVQAQRVLMYCCNDLRRLEGSNCLIDKVEVVDCPRLDYVRVSGMVGEAEVVREPPEEQ